MMMIFENKPKIGLGSFTVKEIAEILNIKYDRVHRWMNVYWDGKLGKEYGEKYSWVTDGKRAVSFHTFVEFYIMMLFSEAGVKPAKVLEAHKELSKMHNTAFPFAKKEVIKNIYTDGKLIYRDNFDSIVSLDGSKQLNLNLIRQFYTNLEFDDESLASKFYPLGKDKSILVDPHRKFGHPVFKNSNLFPEVLFQHYKAGDSIDYLAAVFEINRDEIADAIQYCERNLAA